jgi:SAM-dependent methyltransferase
VPQAKALEGTAEEIPVADAAVDAVFAAEAFHRFEGERAVAEIVRVLRPTGVLVSMWNLPAGLVDPSIARVEQFLDERGCPQREEVGYDPLDLNTMRYESGEWRRPFSDSPFGAFREARASHVQVLDRDGMVAILASMGWIADLPDVERVPLLNGVRSLLDARTYRRVWETHVHWTRLAAT